MTFRDYTQAAFRLRQLGKGQRLRVLVVPEVQELVVHHCAVVDIVSRLCVFSSMFNLVDLQHKMLVMCNAQPYGTNNMTYGIGKRL